MLGGKEVLQSHFADTVSEGNLDKTQLRGQENQTETRNLEGMKQKFWLDIMYKKSKNCMWCKAYKMEVFYFFGIE